MRRFNYLCALITPFFFLLHIFGVQAEATIHPTTGGNVSSEIFAELEELARIVDISYCVGTSGIHKPFSCASRCSEFEGFELITTWNTGPLLSDSCGYIAVSHAPAPPRIIVAFRGTYSIANTIADLSTVPQTYVPYPADGNETTDGLSSFSGAKCENCSVHSGFYSSWINTRPYILPPLESLKAKYPTYSVTLVGHSLGGAVAALASLDFQARGWKPKVTTFGEPRIGNQALVDFIDRQFELNVEQGQDSSYRRVTHVNDPVPLLPLEEWGYKMHAGELYISKLDLSPSVNDLRWCTGDEDPECIAGVADKGSARQIALAAWDVESLGENSVKWGVPARFRMWELLFAHRDYFWRLGLCIPGGDPWDWYRKYQETLNQESVS